MKRKKRRAAEAAESAPEPAASSSSAAAPEPVERSRKRKRRRVAAVEAEPVVTKQKEEEPEPEDEDDDDEDEEIDDEGEGEEEEIDDEDEEEEAGSNIDVEFDCREPDENDFHNVKELLRTPGTWDFIGDSFNYSEFTDSLVGQGNIGSIIKSNADTEDEMSCGVVTILNLRQFSKLSWSKDMQKSLLARAGQHGSPEAAKSLKEVFASQGKGTEVGLLINERFVNLPWEELMPGVHKSLKEDVEWSCSTPECPKDERPFYFFTHLIGVTKCFLSPKVASAAGLQVSGQQGPWFQLGEMEAYSKKAQWMFTFPYRKETKDSSDPAPMGKKKGAGVAGATDGMAVFMITRKALDQVVKNMKAA